MNAPTITTVICDAEPIAIEGLRGILAGQPDFEVLAAVTSMVEAAEAVRTRRPVLLVTNKAYGMHAIADWLQTIRGGGLPTRAAVWGMNVNDSEALRLLHAGAAGVVRKTAPVDDLLCCLRAVAGGGVWLDKELLAGGQRQTRTGHSPLTTRELQVMELVERGLKNKDIAAQLGIRTGTVKIHLKHIFEKTGIHGRYGIALKGLQHKGLPLANETEAAA